MPGFHIHCRVYSCRMLNIRAERRIHTQYQIMHSLSLSWPFCSVLRCFNCRLDIYASLATNIQSADAAAADTDRFHHAALAEFIADREADRKPQHHKCGNHQRNADYHHDKCRNHVIQVNIPAVCFGADIHIIVVFRNIPDCFCIRCFYIEHLEILKMCTFFPVKINVIVCVQNQERIGIYFIAEQRTLELSQNFSVRFVSPTVSTTSSPIRISVS